MMTIYCLSSAISGLLWGGIGFLLIRDWVSLEVAIGAWIASPLIGMLAGLLFLPVLGRGWAWRGLAALLILYLTAALFGLAGGIADLHLVGADSLIAPWSQSAIARRNPAAVLTEPVLATLWGLSFTGLLLLLWPLTLLTHRLVVKISGIQADPWRQGSAVDGAARN